MANNPLYKHAIAVYGVTMVGIPSKNGYGGCKKFPHLTTLHLELEVVMS